MLSGARRRSAGALGEQLSKPERQQKQREQLSQKTVVNQLRTVCADYCAEQSAEREFFYNNLIYQIIFQMKYQRYQRNREKKQKIYALRSSLGDILEQSEPHHKNKAAAKSH